jgi:transcriptional regulator with XRE-family HTH domain
LGRQRLSVNEFAKRLHWTQPYAQRRMSGDVPLDLNDIEQICRELGRPVESVVTSEPVRAVS